MNIDPDYTSTTRFSAPRNDPRCKWLILFIGELPFSQPRSFVEHSFHPLSVIFVVTYLSVSHLSKASLYGIVNIFTVNLNDDVPVDKPRNPSEYLVLDNLSDLQSLLTTTDLRIFFVQTSENEDILSRHACSIESAARLHPAGNVFVLMRSRHILTRSQSFSHLHAYDNIHIVHFDEDDVYSGTSLTRLNRTQRKQYIHYFSISHMSDFLRTALLYKYGGVYFDLDVIPLRSFDTLQNAVALETANGVNVAVLVLEKHHHVLDLQMAIQLKTISSQFHSLCWNCLGPLALTEALKDACDQHHLHVHQPSKCHRVDIQPSYVFYPIPYQVSLSASDTSISPFAVSCAANPAILLPVSRERGLSGEERQRLRHPLLSPHDDELRRREAIALRSNRSNLLPECSQAALA